MIFQLGFGVCQSCGWAELDGCVGRAALFSLSRRRGFCWAVFFPSLLTWPGQVGILGG